jgi:hypothetical protein
MSKGRGIMGSQSPVSDCLSADHPVVSPRQRGLRSMDPRSGLAPKGPSLVGQINLDRGPVTCSAGLSAFVFGFLFFFFDNFAHGSGDHQLFAGRHPLRGRNRNESPPPRAGDGRQSCDGFPSEDVSYAVPRRVLNGVCDNNRMLKRACLSAPAETMG